MSVVKIAALLGSLCLLVACEGGEGATEAAFETMHTVVDTQHTFEELNFRSGIFQERAADDGMQNAASIVLQSAQDQMQAHGFSAALQPPIIPDMVTWCTGGDCRLSVEQSATFSGAGSSSDEVDYSVIVRVVAKTAESLPEVLRHPPLFETRRFLLKTFLRPPFASLQSDPSALSPPQDT